MNITINQETIIIFLLGMQIGQVLASFGYKREITQISTKLLNLANKLDNTEKRKQP